jgi:hypothetical protein
MQYAMHSCLFDAIYGQGCQDAPGGTFEANLLIACMPFPDFQDPSPVFGDSVVDGGLISWPALGRGRFQPEVRMQRGTDIETKNAVSAVARSCDRTDALGEEIDELHTVVRADVGTGAAAKAQAPVHDIGQFLDPGHLKGLISPHIS